MLRRSCSFGSYSDLVSILFSSESSKKLSDSKIPLSVCGIVRDYIGKIVIRANMGQRMVWENGDYEKLALVLCFEQDPLVRARIITHIQPQRLNIAGLKVALNFLNTEERAPIRQFLEEHLNQVIIRVEYLRCLSEFIRTSNDIHERKQLIEKILAKVHNDELLLGSVLGILFECLSKEEAELFFPLLVRTQADQVNDNCILARQIIAFFQYSKLFTQEELIAKGILPEQAQVMDIEDATQYWEKIFLNKTPLANENFITLGWAVRHAGNDKIVSLIAVNIHNAQNKECVGDLSKVLAQAFTFANSESKELIQDTLLILIKRYWTSDDINILEVLFKAFTKVLIGIKSEAKQAEYLNHLMLFVKQHKSPDIARQHMIVEVLTSYMHYYNLPNRREAERLGQVLEAENIQMPKDLSNISQSYIYKKF